MQAEFREKDEVSECAQSKVNNGTLNQAIPRKNVEGLTQVELCNDANTPECWSPNTEATSSDFARLLRGSDAPGFAWSRARGENPGRANLETSINRSQHGKNLANSALPGWAWSGAVDDALVRQVLFKATAGSKERRPGADVEGLGRAIPGDDTKSLAQESLRTNAKESKVVRSSAGRDASEREHPHATNSVLICMDNRDDVRKLEFEKLNVNADNLNLARPFKKGGALDRRCSRTESKEFRQAVPHVINPDFGRATLLGISKNLK